MGLGSCLYWFEFSKAFRATETNTKLWFRYTLFQCESSYGWLSKSQACNKWYTKKNCEERWRAIAIPVCTMTWGGTGSTFMMVNPKNSWTPPLSGTWTKRSFERFSARQPKKDNHPASDSSSLNSRRMLLLGSIGSFASWSYIRAKTIIGIQQPIQPARAGAGRFRREKYLWFGQGNLPAYLLKVQPNQPATTPQQTSQLNKEQRTNSQQGTHHKQQTTNNRQQHQPLGCKTQSDYIQG